MGTMISSGADVIGFLKEQHQQVKAMLDNVTRTHGDERSRAFFELRRMLAVHETAEEEIVHPAARRALPAGEDIVARRLKEENAAKTALAALEKLDVDSPEFEQHFEALKPKILAHAEAEEREEFAHLATKLDSSRLSRMKKAAELAESIAPTRPHPGVESAAANILVGPFVSMVDRTRDAFSKKS